MTSLPARSVRRAVWAALFIAQWLLGSAAMAQALESVLAPGELAQAHAKLEGDCQKCHVKFDRGAQDRLCMDCHKEVGQDVRNKTGFHGRLKPQACKTCHSDHKGREARIVALDKTSFDHSATNFTLRGGHAKVECEKCHLPTRKGFRIAVRDCAACHRKDDVHKGSLGQKCADCHTETSWKEAKFDHSTTHFPLTGKHESVKCADCHKDTNYKETPQACIGCHRKDDKHKARFGEKCETCHGTKDWKGFRFNHDTETHYPLLGKHRATKCESCHTGFLYRDKLSSKCFDCHEKSDKHKGTLGNDCVRCHTERDWKERAKFSHDKTDFPLLGKHAGVQCKDCHKSPLFKEAPKTCVGCHKKDDKHKGSLGDACDKCHNDRDWKKTSFDHAKTAYPLLGKHQTTECAACHKSTNYKEAPKDCYSCHQRVDKHEGQQGKACAQCHDEKAWKPAGKFDHGLARFPLLGKHVQVECKMCHASALFKNAKSECVACHAKDDKHKKTLGAACEQCHNARSWKTWDFDHDTRTKFVLDGKHKGAACSACHTRPSEGRVVTSTLCASCHAKDDVHEGSYGRQCQQCHVTSSFKTIKSRPGRSSLADPAPRAASAGATRVSGAAFRGLLS
ncbi:MAG: cytochrome C [Caldimonas sp.]